MQKFTSPLDNVKVASPCSQDWERMHGNARRRYCGECKLNVYNLSAMTRAEAERLIEENEGSLCVRFYRRADGSILTQDCPTGLAAARARMKTYVTAVASFIATFFGAIGLFSLKPEPVRTMGTMTPTISRTDENPTTGAMLRPTTGEMAYPEDRPRSVTVGNIAVPTPRKR